jgi:hypothetical protein
MRRKSDSRLHHTGEYTGLEARQHFLDVTVGMWW